MQSSAGCRDEEQPQIFATASAIQVAAVYCSLAITAYSTSRKESAVPGDIAGGVSRARLVGTLALEVFDLRPALLQLLLELLRVLQQVNTARAVGGGTEPTEELRLPSRELAAKNAAAPQTLRMPRFLGASKLARWLPAVVDVPLASPLRWRWERCGSPWRANRSGASRGFQPR